MVVNIYDIKWVTDGEDVHLPDAIEMVVEKVDADEISDRITEEVGYLHNGFKYEVMK